MPCTGAGLVSGIFFAQNFLMGRTPHVHIIDCLEYLLGMGEGAASNKSTGRFRSTLTCYTKVGGHFDRYLGQL